MRRSIFALLPLAALAGCGTGYAIDHLRPKTFLIGPQLLRYGLGPDRAQCVGKSLGEHLSVWQLRQLSDIARRVTPGGLYPAALTTRELAWVATQLKDPKIARELARATEDCKAETKAGNDTQATITDLHVLPPPDGGSVAAEASPNSIQDGPKDYQPSDKLWAAFEAYEKGDYPAAARSAVLAAEAGDSGAQQFLGGLYASGHGVPADHAAAVKYYTLAAEQGWSEAMNNLGKAYETGQGIARNPVEALKWYLLASKRPTDDSEVITRNIQNVSGAMSIDQIDEASALAKKWELAHPH